MSITSEYPISLIELRSKHLNPSNIEEKISKLIPALDINSGVTYGSSWNHLLAAYVIECIDSVLVAYLSNLKNSEPATSNADIKVCVDTQHFIAFIRSSEGAEYLRHWNSSFEFSCARSYQLENKSFKKSVLYSESDPALLRRIINATFNTLRCILYRIFLKNIFIRDLYSGANNLTKRIISSFIFKAQYRYNSHTAIVNSFYKSNHSTRKSLVKSVSNHLPNNQLVRSIDLFIANHLPLVFVEGLEATRICAKTIYPTSSVYAMSSYSHVTDDVYKIWIAEQKVVNSEFKLISYQHGFFGAANFIQKPRARIDEICSDFSLAWGQYKKQSSRAFPVGIITTLLFTPQKIVCKINDRKSKKAPYHMCLVINQPNHYYGQIDLEWSQIMNMLFNGFSQKLSSHADVRLIIKPYCNNTLSIQKKIAESYLSSPVYDQSSFSTTKLAKTTQLVVFSYLSTGFCQCVSQNIPAVMLISCESEISPENRPAFDSFVSSGLVHYDLSSFVDHVFSISNDIQGWWNSMPVIESRKEFASLYATPCSAYQVIKTALHEV